MKFVVGFALGSLVVSLAVLGMSAATYINVMTEGVDRE